MKIHLYDKQGNYKCFDIKDKEQALATGKYFTTKTGGNLLEEKRQLAKSLGIKGYTNMKEENLYKKISDIECKNAN